MVVDIRDFHSVARQGYQPVKVTSSSSTFKVPEKEMPPMS
jgi:hypothetical protein